jgi:hypothetical protein
MELKRIISVVLSATVSIIVFALPVRAVTLKSSNNFVIKNGVLTGYNGAGGAIAIPNGVKSISNGVFEDKNITSVNISSSVTDIGMGAFMDTNLTSVTIPGSVKDIEEGAFEDCASLTTVSIQSGVKEIDPFAFQNCSNLMSVTVPKSVTLFVLEAFDGTPWIENYIDDCQSDFVEVGNNILIDYKGSGGNVVIPNGVTDIGTVFEYNTTIKSVTIPSSVKILDNFAFCHCPNLKSVEIPSSVTIICGDLFDDSDTLGYDKSEPATGTVTVYGNAGSEAQSGAKENGAKFKPISNMCLDKPSGTYTGNITVSGWAISVNGVSRVDIYVDGKGLGSVPHSKFTERTDIERIFGAQGYTDLNHSGFSYSISKGKLKNGNHTIRAAVIDNQGNVLWSSQKAFTVKA